MKEVKHTTRAASMLSLRRSASVPVTVVPLALAAFFFTTALDTSALGATRTQLNPNPRPDGSPTPVISKRSIFSRSWKPSQHEIIYNAQNKPIYNIGQDWNKILKLNLSIGHIYQEYGINLPHNIYNPANQCDGEVDQSSKVVQFNPSQSEMGREVDQCQFRHKNFLCQNLQIFYSNCSCPLLEMRGMFVFGMMIGSRMPFCVVLFLRVFSMASNRESSVNECYVVRENYVQGSVLQERFVSIRGGSIL